MLRLGRDPFVAGAVLLVLLPLLVYAIPGVPAGAKGVYAGHLADPLLIAVAVGAVALARRRDGPGRPRRFWGLMGLGLLVWACAALVQFGAYLRGGSPQVQSVVDAIYLLSYVVWLLAADQRPHLGDEHPGAESSFRYAVAGGLLFVLSLIVYFHLLPAGGTGGHGLSTAADLGLFLALDLALALRFALAAWRAGRGIWRSRFVAVAFACAVFAVTDLLNGLLVSGRLAVPFGTPLDALWWIPFVSIVVAARLRPDTDAGRAAEPNRRAESPELFLMYGLLFPVVHLSLTTLGILPAAGRQTREVLVLGCLIAFVALAVGQHRRLERRNRELRMRIDDLATNEKLQHAQKMEAVGRLAGGVAHDFNNLLTVVRGRAEQLRESLDFDDPRRGGLDAILHASERGAGITHRLLAFSRSQVLRPEVLDLNRVLRDGEGVLRSLLGEANPLTLDLAPDLAPVEADGHQLFQVVLNLAANARDAMGPGGRIVIRTCGATLAAGDPDVVPAPRAGRYASLVVEDSGHGMDPATRQRVFEPFFTRKAGGTGLGLATVYGIVVQSGGHVRVRSREGEGTVFEVYLPAARESKETAPARPVAVEERASPGPAVVLLVEDQEAVRDVARDLLELWGFEVVEASSGASALAAWAQRRGRVDVLLSDVVMPGMSGPELARRLREARADLPVVFMSGYAEAGEEISRLPGPRAAFVAKPFAGETLRAAIEAALREVKPSSRPGTPA